MLIGGDVLTEARAYAALKAMLGGDSVQGTCSNMTPVPLDFHQHMEVDQIWLDIYYNATPLVAGLDDQVELYYARELVNRRNMVKTVKLDSNAVVDMRKDFFRAQFIA